MCRLRDKYARGEPITIENFVIDTINKLIRKQMQLRWLKTVSSIFQDVDFDGSLLPLFYQLMLQSWYQKTAQSLVNTLVLFLSHNRLP